MRQLNLRRVLLGVPPAAVIGLSGRSVAAQARKLSQDQPQYAYTLTFYQRQKGERQRAIRELRRLL